MGIFKNISGRTGEDISTEIIAYMLSSRNAYIPFQKLFFNRVLQKPLNSTKLQVEITTQPLFEKGKPDFMISAGNSLLVVENKLGAYLHGDDQLIKYCEVFQKTKTLKNYFPFIEPEKITDRILILLAPKTTIELSIRASNKLCREKQDKDFISWCNALKIKFVPCSWEDVLGDLDLNESIQKELFLFISDFINQEFNEEEIMILKDTNIPAALLKLFNNIADIQNHLVTKDFKTGRLGQSYNYYGFMIKDEKFSVWFGYFLPIWGKYRTPVVVQARESWINIERNMVIEKLKSYGFVSDQDQEFIKPFPVDSIANWKQELVQLLNGLFKL